MVTSAAAVVVLSSLVSPSAGLAASRTAPTSPLIGAVGDIACNGPPGSDPTTCQYGAVSDLAATAGLSAFLPLGDNQYDAGTLSQYQTYYDAYFGTLLPITYPVPGNHEYWTTGATGYFSYFASAAHGPGGYYSYDVGDWHIIALNTATCAPGGGNCGPGSAEYDWLQADLATSSTSLCTLAYWHQPRWEWRGPSSPGSSGDEQRSQYLWDLLNQYGADVVLNGHDHMYQRWTPMDASGNPAPNGIREFIVGTGGRNLATPPHRVTRPATLDSYDASSFGILQLRLRPAGYRWRFVTVAGTAADRGVGACH